MSNNIKPSLSIHTKSVGVTVVQLEAHSGVSRQWLAHLYASEKKDELQRFDEYLLAAMRDAHFTEMEEMAKRNNKRLASIMQAGKNNEGCL